jgi:hypothetical protein
MQTLPGISDIAVVLVLLVSGFLSFIVAKKLAAVDTKFSDFETTVISVFLSLVSFVPFSVATGLTDLDKIRTGIFVPWNILLLVSFTTAIGIALGGTFKLIFRRSAASGTLWNYVFARVKKLKGSWVLVITENGAEYKGWIISYGESPIDGSKDLTISNPMLVVRNQQGTVTDEIAMGKEIMFVNDIKRVVFLNDVSEGEEAGFVNNLILVLRENAVLIVVISIVVTIMFMLILFLLVLK